MLGAMETPPEWADGAPAQRALNGKAPAMLTSKSTLPHRGRHAGFTLIELLMVILILAALIALLLPAIASVRSSVRISQVRTEIAAIDQGLAAFRSTFGVTPPSRLILPEHADGWTAPVTRETKAAIRRIWPSFDFKDNGDPAGGTPPLPGDPRAVGPDNPVSGNRARDFNRDGDETDVVVLTGAECLMFFLGGIRDESGIPSGFSTHPSMPFVPRVNAAPSATTKGPFVDFATDPNRIVDVDGDGMPELTDPLPSQSAPYLYAEGRDGKGYRKDASGRCPDLFVFTNDLANPTDGDMKFVYAYPGGTRPYQKEGHQIISPGFDGQYGVGGEWEDGATLSGDRDPERDNITNFHGGTLE